MTEIFRRYVGALTVSLGYGMFTPFVGELADGNNSFPLLGALIGLYPLAKACGYGACLHPSALKWSERTVLGSAAMAYALLGFTLHPVAVGIGRTVEGFAFGWFMAKSSLAITSNKKAVGERLSWLNGLSSAGVVFGPVLVIGSAAFGRAQAAFLIVATLCALAALSISRETEIVTPDEQAHLSISFAPSAIAFLALFALFDMTYGVLSLAVPIKFQPLPNSGTNATAALFSVGFLIFTVFMPAFGWFADRGNVKNLLFCSLSAICGVFAILSISSPSPLVFGILLFVEFVLRTSSA